MHPQMFQGQNHPIPPQAYYPAGTTAAAAGTTPFPPNQYPYGDGIVPPGGMPMGMAMANAGALPPSGPMMQMQHPQHQQQQQQNQMASKCGPVALSPSPLHLLREYRLHRPGSFLCAGG